jgi:HAD superfamily hydrolase (TIGR01662 family)
VSRLLRPALFLDRDGVLNEDRGYVHRWEDFCWIPGAREAVAAFNARNWWVFVVTNQSGVGRGYYPEADVLALHARMEADLAVAGARIDAFYYCPFHPEALEDRYVDAYYQLDFYGSYAFSRSWKVFVEVNNLTNEPFEAYWGESGRLSQYEEYGVSGALGLKWQY